jgi:hypothetical protein
MKAFASLIIHDLTQTVGIAYLAANTRGGPLREEILRSSALTSRTHGET